MKTNVFILTLFFVSIIYGQQEKVILSHSMNLDNQISKNLIKNNVEDKNEAVNKKLRSPFLAGVLSFAVPGAGAIYNNQYLKAAIYLGIEAVAIAVGVTYDKKGDDQTEFFQNYANQHWSVERYARWTLANADKINPLVNPSDYKVFDDNGKVNWSELNRLEGDLGGYYSHRLAPYGDQQYYEMIGKYSQFNVGWEEFGDDPNKPFRYGDPLTNQFEYYSEQRGLANTYYDYAKWAVISIISNHIISAFESAWATKQYNKTVQMNVSVEKVNFGYFVEYFPKFNVKIQF